MLLKAESLIAVTRLKLDSADRSVMVHRLGAGKLGGNLLSGRIGWGWSRLLSGWMKNMAFALVVMDLAFCYIRFSVLYAFRSRIRPRSS
eukprot:5162904-Pleurochrysis_carterae.AAC.1